MKLREGWNFHGDIALPLEKLGAHQLGYPSGRDNPIVGANTIETGDFVAIMLYLLENAYGKSHDYYEFETKCKPYKGKHSFEIPDEIAAELYNEFETKIKENR